MQGLRALVGRLARLRLPLYAANVCYFLVLSVFPGLLLVLATLRYTPLSATDLIGFLQTLVPAALMPAVERLIVSTYYNSDGAMLSVSAVTALWSASRGVYGLMIGLNRVYGVREDRGWFYTRLISAVYLFALLPVLAITLVFHTSEPLLLPLTQIAVFTLLYMVLPNRKNRFLSSLPGAALSAVGWQGFSRLFSLYVIHSQDYASIYGSVYAMALGMLWLYCCTLILLFGGAVNRFLSQDQAQSGA